MLTLEIAAYNIESAFKAQVAGADRIELCADPGGGGTTPSYGVIDVVRQNINIDLFTMIRPRGGDFLYSSYEFHAMKRDIGQCQRLSVDGIVFGILDPKGNIDKKRCRELIERARPLKVTCHRAFDMTRDPLQAMEDCIEVGFDRILTSGQHARAADGIELLKKLVEAAGKRITIMAGSGINPENAETIVRKTGVRELHFSASGIRDSLMEYRNEQISTMGTSQSNEFQVRTVDEDFIKRVRAVEEMFR